VWALSLPQAGVVLPVVAGNDTYTAMIRNLLFLWECGNSAGEQVQLPSFDLIDVCKSSWMENKVHTPKYVEEERLESLLAYVWQFEKSQSMARAWAELENKAFLLFWAQCVNIC
jgi:hypothetical protein